MNSSVGMVVASEIPPETTAVSLPADLTASLDSTTEIDPTNE